jgi:hypothetical protein
VLGEEVRAGRPKDAPQRRPHDQRIVELSGHGDEVGDEVERQRQVPTGGKQHQLVATSQARVACQAREEDRAVGNEAGDLGRSATPCTGAAQGRASVGRAGVVEAPRVGLEPPTLRFTGRSVWVFPS